MSSRSSTPWRRFSAARGEQEWIAGDRRGRGRGGDPFGSGLDRVDPTGRAVPVLDRAPGGSGVVEQAHRLGDAGEIPSRRSNARRRRSGGARSRRLPVGRDRRARHGSRRSRRGPVTRRTRRSWWRAPRTRLRPAAWPNRRPTGWASRRPVRGHGGRRTGCVAPMESWVHLDRSCGRASAGFEQLPGDATTSMTWRRVTSRSGSVASRASMAACAGARCEVVAARWRRGSPATS